jgi:DNA-binding NtrC family response regulator
MIELADGGTLFLDNISALTPEIQRELLRVLETGTSTPLGGRRPLRVDFRTICATSQDLETLVEDGRFQDDLHVRVNGFGIHLPPLRERPQDVPLLAEHFLKKYSTRMQRFCRVFAPEAMELLRQYSWPGNVRELANAVERAVVVCTTPTIRREDLPASLGGEGGGATGDSLAEVSRAHIRRIIEQTGWNMTQAAKVLQIDRKTLSGRLARYGLRDQRSQEAGGNE